MGQQTTWGEYAEEAEKAGGGFGNHPVGVFNMRVDTADTKPAKNDKRAILTRLVTIDGPAAGKSILNNMTPFKNDGDPNGFFMQHLGALGFGREQNPTFWAQMEGLTHEQGVTLIAQAIVGAEATVTVNLRKYMGEMTDNVKAMAPLGSKAVTTVLEPEIPTAAPSGVPAVPGPAAVPVGVPVSVPPVVAAPVAAPTSVAAVPTPVAQPVVAAPPVAVPDATPAAVPEAEPADVPASGTPPIAGQDVIPQDVPTPVATPVAAAIPPVARPDGAPF